MDPHNLAIIFAPSLLQGSNNSNPDQLLKMMPKQTKYTLYIVRPSYVGTHNSLVMLHAFIKSRLVYKFSAFYHVVKLIKCPGLMI